MSALLAVAMCALVLTAMLAGIHVFGLGGLNPAMRSLDADAYLAVKQSADKTIPRVAKPLMLGSLVATGGLLVVAGAAGHGAIAVVSAFALLALLATLAAILRGDLPINRQMAGWTTATLPADWQQFVATWNRFFLVRVLTNLAALVSLIVVIPLAR